MTYTVYRCYDRAGGLLYVGVTKCVEKRLYQHRRYAPWYSEMASTRFQHFGTDAEASREEYRAITTEHPRYNQALHRQRYVDYGTCGCGVVDGCMTLAEAARRGGLTANNLRRQIANGVIPAQRLGSMLMVSERDLDRYVREHKGKRGRPPKGDRNVS